MRLLLRSSGMTVGAGKCCGYCRVHGRVLSVAPEQLIGAVSSPDKERPPSMLGYPGGEGIDTY